VTDPHQLTSRERVRLAASNALLVLATVLGVLWAASMIRGCAVTRRTTVLSGSTIQPTDPAETLTEYISHNRTVASHVGRVYVIYMRAEESNKSKDLPRRVSWHFAWSPGRRHDRFKAPSWIAWSGLDWRADVAEGGRPNGEYWSNRDIFVCVPYWLLALPTAAAGWLLGRRVRLKRRRLRRGLCIACGYDVRMSPGRCPECGLTNPPPVTAPGAA